MRHTEPAGFMLDYVLIPIGYKYNESLQKAKRGELIRFYNGGSYEIVSIRRLKLGGSGAEILCRMRYGVSLKYAMKRWKENALLEGHGAQAVSQDECLWVIYDRKEVTAEEK